MTTGICCSGDDLDRKLIYSTQWYNDIYVIRSVDKDVLSQVAGVQDYLICLLLILCK